MWKHIVAPHRLQMTIYYGACALHAGQLDYTHTHTHRIYNSALPWAQWFHECASMLRFYVHFLSFYDMFDRNDTVIWFHSLLHDPFRLTASAGPYGWPRTVTSLKRSTTCTITQRSCYRYHINRSHNEATYSPISSDRPDTSRQDKKIRLNRKICCIFKVNNSPRM